MTQDDKRLEACKFVKPLLRALELRDAETSRHCERVAALSEELAEACGLSESDVATTRVAALLHDVGKIGLPDAILNKPGALDAGEREIVETHAVKGERIVLQIGLEETQDVARIVRSHHECFDGGGYPDGLSHEAIPKLSRIIAVADCYDAMTRARVYRAAMAHEEVMAILRSEAGRKFDPPVFEVFSAMIEQSASKAR